MIISKMYSLDSSDEYDSDDSYNDDNDQENDEIVLFLSMQKNIKNVAPNGITEENTPKIICMLSEIDILPDANYAIFTGVLSDKLVHGYHLSLSYNDTNLIQKSRIDTAKEMYESTRETIHGEKTKMHFINKDFEHVMAIVPKEYLKEYYEVHRS